MAYNDTFGVLSEFREKVGENQQEYVTTFGYDTQNRPVALNYGTFGGSTTTLDALNRMTYSSVKLGNTAFKSEYHFVAGGYGSGSLTGLVTSITQTGGNCSYGYDDNGNIANATVNGKWAGYTYDALGQLIRVNDRSDTRAGSTGSTWVYEYDRGGNILSKKLYPYADTSSDPLLTTRFTYGNANWKDQLTALDGVAITYDAIGNPLNDGTWTYTWQNGRQLAAMRKSGMEVSFRYNANGLRTHKIVNGVVTKYTLHGKNVVHMTKGSDELHFFYDAQNRPAVVVYNGTAYAYVKNLQGDVIAILDSTGAVVVSYVYDAWGQPIGKAGTLASTLGTLNPFRYRGYVYDEETGLYYLKSRCYNPSCCRFINADVYVGRGGLFSHNTYAYCRNSVCNRIDFTGAEDGECPQCQTTGAICLSVTMTPDQMLEYIRCMDAIYPGAGIDSTGDYVLEETMSSAEDIPVIGWVVKVFNFLTGNSEQEQNSGNAYVERLFRYYILYKDDIVSFRVDAFVTRRELKVTAYYIKLKNVQQPIVVRNNAYTIWDQMAPGVFYNIIQILKDEFDGMATHTHPDHADTYDSYMNEK